MAAERLAAGGVAVTVDERMPSVGRKFLLAGRGGLNLTHSEPTPELLARYGAATGGVSSAIEQVDAAALRAWAEGLGEPTFVGSSGRVFPKSFRAAPLLRAWLKRLDDLGVRIEVRHTWLGWDGPGTDLVVTGPRRELHLRPDLVVLAMGGA